MSEAAVRDRAQRAAHDVAQLEGLPSEELRRRRDELAGPASREADIQQGHRHVAERIAAAEEKIAIFSRPAPEPPPQRWWHRAPELPQAEPFHPYENVLARRLAERDALPPIREEAHR